MIEHKLLSLLPNQMTSFLKTRRYGKGNKETQVCQRPALYFEGKKEDWFTKKYFGKQRDLLKEKRLYGLFETQTGCEDYEVGGLSNSDIQWRKLTDMAREAKVPRSEYVRKIAKSILEEDDDPPLEPQIAKSDLEEDDDSPLKPQKQSCYNSTDLRKLVQHLAGYANVKYSEELISHIEGISALMFTLQGCNDYLAMSGAIVLYLRKFIKYSVTSHIIEYITKLLEFGPQSGEENSFDDDKNNWIDMMRNMRDNWTAVRNNKLFSNFSKLLGLIVTLQLCEASNLTFSIKEYKIWEPDMSLVHGDAVDVIDAALSTVSFFVERISICWNKGSLKPLLLDENEATDLDQEFASVIMWWELVKNGNLTRILKKSEHEFDSKLENLTVRIRDLVKGVDGKIHSHERNLLYNKYMRLLTIKNDFVTLKLNSGVRKAPFCIELYGESSQGKTTFGEQIVQALLVSAGLPTDKEYQATYNSSDKFWSTWRTLMLVLFMDDMCNEKGEFVERPPTKAVVEVGNNVPFAAPKAELGEKGKCFVEPEIVVVTTNVKDLDARVYSNCPYSIQRRMHIVITVVAKKEFQYIVEGQPQGIDPSKVARYNKEHPDMAFDDIWELTLEKAVRPQKMNMAAGYEPVVWRDPSTGKRKVMKDVSFRDAMQYLIEKFHEHRAEQEHIIKRMKSRSDICVCGVDGCRQIKGWCTEPGHCKEVDIPIPIKHTGADEERPETSLEDFLYNTLGRDEKLPAIEKIDENEVQFGEEIVQTMNTAGQIVKNRISKDIFGIDTAIEGVCTLGILRSARFFSKHWDWLYLIPTPWLTSNNFRSVMQFVNRGSLQSDYIRNSCLLWSSLIGTMWMSGDRTFNFKCGLGAGLFATGLTLQRYMFRFVKWNFDRTLNYRNAISPLDRPRLRKYYVGTTCILWTSIFGTMWFSRGLPLKTLFGIGSGLFAAGVTIQKSIVDVVKIDFDRSLVDRDIIHPIIDDFRTRHVGNICRACALIGTIYGIAQVYKAWRKIQPQGSLEPKTIEDIQNRDRQSDAWTKVAIHSLPTNPDAASATSKQLRGLVEKNIVYGSVHMGNKSLRVNGLFLTTGIVVIPDHYFETEVLDCTMNVRNPKKAGNRFAVRLSKQQSVLIPKTDIRICYASSGGSFRDIRRYLPVDDFPTSEFDMQWRDKDGNMAMAAGLASQQMTSNGYATFVGLYYRSLTINTFKGLCGAVLTSKVKPIIMGIHLGGISDHPKGCAGILFSSQVADAISKLKKIEGVMIGGSSEKFEPQVLGVKIITGTKLHHKSPLNYMPKGSQIQFYGTCSGMSKFRSNVKVTPISRHITDVCNSPNVYRPPIEEPQWEGWQTCLANMSVPALPFDPRLLIVAIRDYKEDMIPLFQKDFWKSTRPLNDDQNLCGVQGVKFIDAINLNTSIGFPLTGEKRRFVTELEPTLEKPNNRIFDKVIVDEIKRCEDCYKRGERAFVIAKACKKDEVLSKRKCRIFYGNGIALTFLIRRYFLPILRVMQFNPKVSECAVGVNSHGPEWQELHEHIVTFGMDRLIGGDYGKYDQKLPSQLLLAAFRIMIDFARECDYSEEDLNIMEAMTSDVVYAVIAFNGDLIGLTEGTHISGNSLTVILNGICGSLNLRCYFYHNNLCFPFEKRKKFRDYVKLITYGDDNIGSVSNEIDNFTIKGASEFLSRYGQTYTMPDKESELLDFLPPNEFEFLKRKSVWHPELNVHVGALDEKSCFKMLHCFLRDRKSPISENHACALNIDTALREWFNHGEEVYDMRRHQMIEVADRAGIAHLCSELYTSYDEHVVRWKMKYLDFEEDEINFDSPIEVFNDLQVSEFP